MRGAKIQYIVVCPYNHCIYGDKEQIDDSCRSCKVSVVRKDCVIEKYEDEHKECQEVLKFYWKEEKL